MLNVMDIVTLDDDNSYIVLNVTELDGVHYVSLIDKNNMSNFKLLEEVTKDEEVILREVLDEIKIEKIKLQVLKESTELLKIIQKENKN